MLRDLSNRGLVIVDDHRRSVSQNGTTDSAVDMLGLRNIPSRARVVSALKLDNNPPVLQEPRHLITDQMQCFLADPTNNSLVGRKGLRIHRLLRASRV